MRTPRLIINGVVTIALILMAGASFPSAARQADSVVWYGITTPVPIPDAGTVDSLVYVDGVGSPILDVRVSLHITHAALEDLDVSLVGPDGTIVDLTSDNGGGATSYGSACTPDASRTAFDDAASTIITEGTAPLVGAFRPEQPLTAFAGKSGPGAANGIWRLRIADDTAGHTGSLQCWSLFISADLTAPLALNDAFSTPMDTQLVVPAPGVLANDDPGGTGPMTAATVSSPVHGFLAFNSDGSFTYTPSAGYSGLDTFAYRAFNGIGSVGSNVALVYVTVAAPTPTAVDDAYAVGFQTPLNIPAPGVLVNDVNPVSSSSMFARRVADPLHGSLTLNTNGSFTYTPSAGYVGADSFTYEAVNTGGAGNTATVFLTVSGPTTIQPPTGFFVYSVVGNLVTLRWTPPASGPVPTQYVLEGGINPSEVLASFPTGNAAPIFAFVAPTGSFYVRLHSISGAEKSAPSNEIRLHVNVPVAPSAPVAVVSLVNGSMLHLAWRNTFVGGAPGRMALEVTGAFTGALSIGAVDTFSFAGVPAGTYTLRLFAVNGGGVSLPSNPVTVTFPGDCSGAPSTPSGLLAYRIGNTVFVVWDPAPTGPAPTAYVLSVTGAFTGTFSTATRAISGVVGRGSYNVSVVATNPCGSSAATAVHTVVVP